MTDTPNIAPKSNLSPRTIVGIYAAVGTLWIVLSDNVVTMFAGDIQSLCSLSTVKGALFIVVTSFLLHALIRRFAGEIRLSRDIFSRAFTASPDSVTITRVSDGGFLHVNEGFGLITGYNAEDLNSGFRAAELWVDPSGRERFADALKAGEAVREMEAAFRTKEGDQIVGLISACGFELAGELCAVTVIRDITEEKLRAEEMRRLANYDGESGLPNMTLLSDRLNQTLAMDGRNKRGTAVVSVRLENFEDIVDALDLAGGAEVVRTVAERLSGLIRQSDTLARIHREEYAIVIGGSALESDIDTVLNKLVAALALPIPTERGEVMVSAFVGIACFPSDGLSSEILLQNARRAMNQARERGEHGCHFFSPVLNDKAVERRLIETSMLRALDNGEFFLCYQPKYAVDGLRLTGMEALLRWRHPGFGDIPPARFIPIAEKNGMILDLGLWVLRTACQQNKEWQDAGLPALPVSVNISGRQLLDHSFVEQVASVLAETGLSPHLLEFELTESVVMGTSDGTVLKLLRLRDLGIRIAIDDFGTGYSSLSYLSRLPIDRLKIDRSFVMDLSMGSDSAAIIDAVIAMADSLKLKVTAEGVETREQYDYLAGRRCHELQGFLFSRPLDTPRMEQLLREGETGSRLPEQQRKNSLPAGAPGRGEKGPVEDEAPAIPEYLKDISVAIPPIAPGETITEAWRRFQEKADLLALPVVDKGKAVGVVKRFTFFEEHIIGKHGFGIHINHSKKIRDLMDPEVVTLEAEMRIRDVAQAMHSLKMGSRLDNICVAAKGVYSGIIEVSRLANAVAEINLLLARNANPLSGLPGNDNIQREISGRLSAGRHFDIAYVDIDNFKPYNDHYGFQKGDVVIRALAEVIERTVAKSGSFCGHIGGDDFIIITEPFHAEKTAEEVIAGFEEHLAVFHGDRDFACRSYTAANRRGEEERFGLLSLSIGIVNTRSTPVESYAQLASLATEVKKAAKRRPGSSVVVNARVR